MSHRYRSQDVEHFYQTENYFVFPCSDPAPLLPGPRQPLFQRHALKGDLRAPKLPFAHSVPLVDGVSKLLSPPMCSLSLSVKFQKNKTKLTVPGSSKFKDKMNTFDCFTLVKEANPLE